MADIISQTGGNGRSSEKPYAIIWICVLVIVMIFGLGACFYFGQKWYRYHKLEKRVAAGDATAVEPLSKKPYNLSRAICRAAEKLDPVKTRSIFEQLENCGLIAYIVRVPADSEIPVHSPTQLRMRMLPEVQFWDAKGPPGIKSELQINDSARFHYLFYRNLVGDQAGLRSALFDMGLLRFDKATKFLKQTVETRASVRDESAALQGLFICDRNSAIKNAVGWLELYRYRDYARAIMRKICPEEYRKAALELLARGPLNTASAAAPSSGYYSTDEEFYVLLVADLLAPVEKKALPLLRKALDVWEDGYVRPRLVCLLWEHDREVSGEKLLPAIAEIAKGDYLDSGIPKSRDRTDFAFACFAASALLENLGNSPSPEEYLKLLPVLAASWNVYEAAGNCTYAEKFFLKLEKEVFPVFTAAPEKRFTVPLAESLRTAVDTGIPHNLFRGNPYPPAKKGKLVPSQLKGYFIEHWDSGPCKKATKAWLDAVLACSDLRAFEEFYTAHMYGRAYAAYAEPFTALKDISERTDLATFCNGSSIPLDIVEDFGNGDYLCRDRDAAGESLVTLPPLAFIERNQVFRIPKRLQEGVYLNASEIGENWDRYGAQPGTESTVLAGLRWLHFHQDKPEGRWDVDDYQKNCKGPGAPCLHIDQSALDRKLDAGVSGLSLLAFLGYGQTHRHGKFKRTVRRGLKWLMGEQDKKTGLFGPKEENRFWMVNHAMATTAVCEAFAVTRDNVLKGPAQRAVDFLVEAQNPGSGWGFEPKDGEPNAWATAWAVLALKAAKMGKLKIPESAFEGAVAFFDSATDSKGKTWLHAPGVRGKVVIAGKDIAGLPDWTGASGLCRIFCGQKRNHPAVKKAAEFCLLHPPEWPKGKADEVNFQYIYFSTYCMFQVGGHTWRRWTVKLKEALCPNQRSGRFCQDGSWDPRGIWGKSLGRAGVTAIAQLTLEIYYRYARAGPYRSLFRRNYIGVEEFEDEDFETSDLYPRLDAGRPLRSRIRAANILGRRVVFFTKKTVECLAGYLSDPEPVMRGAAANALGRFSDEEARAALEAALKQEKNADVRDVIKVSIEKIRIFNLKKTPGK